MEDFLRYEPVYSIEQLSGIELEFSRLKDTTYLDHAGATLYSEKQIQNILNDLATSIYANPHSLHISSKSTEDAVDVIRYQILQHFKTTNNEYSVVFTSGTTSSLKIIAECFNYGDKFPGTLAYLEDNHTSVLGMRNLAKNVAAIKTEDAFALFSKHDTVSCVDVTGTNNLFVYPAECNFSGTKFPLEWIEEIHKGALNELVTTKSKNWYVVLDSPGFAATNNLDLSRYKPDFVLISFYKIFGYPTGLGALLVRKPSEELLRKKYFGGGTVSMALSSQNVMVPRSTFHERFEDGTLPFLSILSVKHGFDTIKRLKLNFNIISKHTFSLAQYVFKKLITLHHSNGKPVVILYHDTTFQDSCYQGGKVNFTLLRPNGDHVGYSEVLHMANLHGIHLRTGCHCNPGACQRFLKLNTSDVLKQFKSGHVCGDQNDLIDGYPTGTVRISFGYMSTKRDCDTFLKMIESCFVSLPIIRKMPSNWNQLEGRFQKLFHGQKQPSGHVCGDQNDLIDGYPTGTVRISFGYMSTKRDCDTFLKMIESCFVSLPIIRKMPSNWNQLEGRFQKLFHGQKQPVIIKEADKNLPNSPTITNYEKQKCQDIRGNLDQIFLYPIKSCGAFQVSRNWILTPKGLKYDREWMIINSAGVCLTQKQNKKLCLVKPVIDLRRKLLVLQSKGHLDIEIKLDYSSSKKEAYLCQTKICGDRVTGLDCGDEVSDWLSKTLDMPGLRLLRQYEEDDTTSRISFANKAQYLLLNSKSVEWLRSQVPEGNLKENLNSTIQRFRPNFVVNFGKPFEENDLTDFFVGDLPFKAIGKCSRCQMICIDQDTGCISKEPLLTLSRELKGKINFGIYVNQAGSEIESEVEVKCKVVANSQNVVL